MKIAIVTGASSGMGREFVRQLHNYIQPDVIWAIARRQSALEALAAETAIPVRPIVLDLGQASAFQTLAAMLKAEKPEVELLVTQADNATYEEEAAVVAQRTAELLDGKHFVRNGETLRPIVPEDIVILLRSPGSIGGYYADALAKKGIRCTTGGGEDLLQTREISVLRALLQIIGNPRQDIPLIGVLASPLFGFTADELALIRSKNRKCSIYDSLLLAVGSWDARRAWRRRSVHRALLRIG